MTFKERLANLGHATYGDYLRSDHWRAFRAAYLRSGGVRRCAVCGAGRVQLHHHTYVRLGREEMGDVTPLCRTHHVAVHEWLKASGRVFVGHTHEAVAALGGVPVRRMKRPKANKGMGKASRLAIRKAVFAPLKAEMDRLRAEGGFTGAKRYLKACETLDAALARAEIESLTSRLTNRVPVSPKKVPTAAAPKVPKRVIRVAPLPVNAKAEPTASTGWVSAFRAKRMTGDK